MTTDLASCPVASPPPVLEHARDRSPERPGVLRGRTTLTLQTREAQRLVKGRQASADKPAIIGLLGFAAPLRTLWHGARADDPYADWWLVRVHEALEGAQAQLSEQQAALSVEDTHAIQVTVATSVKPVRVPLEFCNPYAFRGAWLLARYDALACAVLTARHVGLRTSQQSMQLLHHAARQVRRAFSSPLGFRLMRVTRTDITRGSVKAAQAQSVMGALPPDVLSGVRRAPYAPAVESPRRMSSTQPFVLQPIAAETGD